jgi:uncharacterized membrane protein
VLTFCFVENVVKRRKAERKMMVKLNRFLTTGEVQEMYRIPKQLMAKLSSSLPVAAQLDDGSPLHLESDIDEFFTEWSRRQRNVSRQLIDKEADILEAIAGGRMTGEEVAKRTGYMFNSNFKSTLSSLVKRGLLKNERPGYRKA